MNGRSEEEAFLRPEGARSRSAAALGWLAGYLILGFGPMVILLYIAWHVESAYIQGSLAGLATVFVIAVIPFRRRGQLPLKITRDSQPRLFERVNRMAAAAGQPAIAELYVFDEPDIGIYHPRSILGFGGRIRHIVGLPLFHFFSVSELDAIFAALFAYQRTGDLRTRSRLGSTQNWLERSRAMMEAFFCFDYLGWYARGLDRAIERIHHLQNLAADQAAVGVVGAAVYSTAVRKFYALSSRFYGYLYGEVLPAADRGYRLPLMEGFATYCEAKREPRAELHKADERRLEERLAAIARYPEEPAGDPAPAISLLDNYEEIEKQVISALPSGETPAELRSIPWTQAAYCSVLPTWHSLRRGWSEQLCGLTLGDLPRAAAQPERLTYATKWEPSVTVPVELSRAVSKRVLVATLGTILTRQGWYIDHAPGYLRIRSIRHEVDPSQLIDEMAGPEFTNEKWQEMLERWELDPAVPLAAEPI